MIEEAYVSFETAKLLKEKNFKEIVQAIINADKEIYMWPYGLGVYQLTSTQFPYVTQQMAMRWLRETHNLFIRVGFGNDNKGNFLYMADIYDLTNDTVDGLYKPIVESNDYLFTNPKTYEEATEEGIKYCLKNLI